ncbi:hypothetical protein [Streptomyces sp. MMBL 11-1]|uniref:hypothetical protein n=1 Tax=Streptomyces sp. MMBL 11-1 TaxID=3026420 RepID=UPI002360257A|nr:hypothetical protein [Streptomyces sp. MMBL 11-1]
MPTAREVFPPGTPADVCVDFNRRRKSVPTAMELFRLHGGRLTESDIARLSDRRIAEAARSAGVKVPGGDETRNMIRAELRKLAGLPPQPGDIAPAEVVPAQATVTSLPATALTAAHLDALLTLGLPVVLVPTRSRAA